MTNVLEAIRTFIKEECPCLEEFYNGLGVDYLEEEDTAYMIEAVPANPIVKRYINSDTERQCVFAFSSRESYGSNVRRNLENIGFFDVFADWMEQCNREERLPKLGEKQTAKKLEVLTSGYVYQAGVDKAQYRIQCRLIYLQERR